MKDMLSRFKNLSGKIGLELNTKNTKVMLFRKKGGRRKAGTYKWNEEELEVVKNFDYLEYTLKGNNTDTDYIRKIKEKANGTIGRMWSLAERKLKKVWDLRRRLFEIMVKGVIMYGAENWGWREWREIEGLKMKYVRWSMKLNRSTPWHTIRKDIGVRKMALEAAGRAMKFEEKLSRAKEDSLERIAWKQACRDEEEKWSRGEEDVVERQKGIFRKPRGFSQRMERVCENGLGQEEGDNRTNGR